MRLAPSLAFVALAAACDAASPPLPDQRCEQSTAGAAVPGFHGSARDGHSAAPDGFSIDGLLSNGLRPRWVSEPFDALQFAGRSYPPLLYASPLLSPEQAIESDVFRGTTDVVYAATSNGWVYAVDAGGCEPGRILWRRRVADAAPIDKLDQGVPMGVLSTPVLDLDGSRIYLAAHDRALGWQVHALALDTGDLETGWPVSLDDDALAPHNTNGPARFQAAHEMSQRGALALSPDGARVYVPFGTYWGDGAGWLVSVDTRDASIAAAFSSAPSVEDRSNGGIWGSAGPSVDDEGRVWATTGNSPPGTEDAPGVWGNSLLQLSADLVLDRVYSPFNYCTLDAANMDLGASQPHLLAPLPASRTPNLVAFGGKQGVVYLLDADALPQAGEGRGPCSTDARTDGSLLAPDAQPQFDQPGPLSVFGPYSDTFGQVDHAKMRSKLAEWTDADDTRFLFATGTSKAAEDSTDSVPPSIAKLRVDLDPTGAAYLRTEQLNTRVGLLNPGSPLVTGTGDEAVVWVLDRNALRSAPLLDAQTPKPRLYAFAASDLRLLWSGETEGASGKYASPIVVGDSIVVGTDRIEAWGLAQPDPVPQQP